MPNSNLAKSRGPGTSVVIPCYNASEYISNAISSALLSGVDEIIVVDDGSTDNSVAKAKQLGAIVIEQVNSGPAISRMNGLIGSNFQNVIFLDADDELIPEGVRELSHQLHIDEYLVGSVGTTLVRRDGKIRGKIDIEPKGLTFESLLLRGLPPGPPACATWRVSAILNATQGHVPEPKTNHAEDYAFFLAMANYGRIAKIDTNVCVYNAGQGRSSKNIERGLADVDEIRKFYSGISGVEIKSRSSRELSQLIHFRLYYEASWSTPIFKVKNLFISFFEGPSKFLKGLISKLWSF